MIPEANAQFDWVRGAAAWSGMVFGDVLALIVCRFGVDLDIDILLRRPLDSELDNRDERVGWLEAILD